MGYGSAYSSDTYSHITKRESDFLDRIFIKALANTSFGRKEKQRLEAGYAFTLIGNEVERSDGAEILYQQTGLYFFGDNKFAFRDFSDTKEYRMPLMRLQKAPIWAPSRSIIKRLPESLDKALEEVKSRCIPSKVKPEYVPKSDDFRKGARELYVQVRKLAPYLIR